LDDARVTTASEVATTWGTKGTPTTFTGDGVERYRAEFDAQSAFTIFDQVIPSVRAAIALGLVRPADEVVTPLYLRDADAVANFTTRKRPQ